MVDSQDTSKPKSHWVTKLGIALILLSGILWFSLFAIPFVPLPLSTGQRTAWAAAQFIAVQFAWWGGSALAGPEVVGRIWRFFRRK